MRRPHHSSSREIERKFLIKRLPVKILRPRHFAGGTRDPFKSATIRHVVAGDAWPSIAQDALRNSVEKSQDRSRHLSRSQPWFGGGGSGISKPREPPPF